MRIGLDIDGVLADFNGHFIEYLEFEDKSTPTQWDDPRIRDNFHKVAQDEEFWLSMPILVQPKILDFIPVIYVTARPIRNHTSVLWLKRNGFPNAEVVTVGHNGKKAETLKGRVDYFVDDALHNYTELTKAGINCALLDQPYNQGVNIPTRIYSINQVLNLV